MIAKPPDDRPGDRGSRTPFARTARGSRARLSLIIAGRPPRPDLSSGPSAGLTDCRALVRWRSDRSDWPRPSTSGGPRRDESRDHRDRQRAGQRAVARHEQPVAQPGAGRGGDPGPRSTRRSATTWTRTSRRSGSRSSGPTWSSMTGGLGPTQDDLTREALAQVAGVPLVEDAASLEAIAAMFARRNRADGRAEPRPGPLPERGRAAARTASAPRRGSGCGSGGRSSRCLPGVPSRDEAHVRRAGAPQAPRGSGSITRVIVHRKINLFGKGRVGHRGRGPRPDRARPRARGRHHRARRHDQLPGRRPRGATEDEARRADRADPRPDPRAVRQPDRRRGVRRRAGRARRAARADRPRRWPPPSRAPAA